MSRLLLVRHGQTEWNVLGLYQGHQDSPLTARGREQALTAARRLESEGAARVVASDLGRALNTAQIIADHLKLKLHTEPGLRELDMGRLAGLAPEQIHAWPGYRRESDWRWPEGETFDELQARVLRAIRAWVSEPDPSILVTHAGPVRALLRVTRGLSYEKTLSQTVDPTHVLVLADLVVDS